MKRRNFLFWVSLGLFQAGEALQIDGLDRLAAATINARRRRAPSKPVRVETIVEAPPVEVHDDEEDAGEAGQPDAKRRARHGRPPSRWLRSLEAEELSVWLKTIDVPEAGVSGMTYRIHLTRDHSFDDEKIKGLTIDEQALLHSAAHEGY